MIRRFTIIVGAARCGTTSLFRYLSEHPQVCPSRIKEPNFFASEEHLLRGRAWYESLWDWDPDRHRVALEATTASSVYPVYPSAAQQMAKFDAEFKILYIVRNPMEQIPSNYTLAVSMSSPWADADSEWWSGPRINRFFLACASYATQLDEYRRYFDRDDVMVLRFEDLKNDPAELLARVCGFLGIDASFQFETAGSVNNATRGNTLPPPWWNVLKRSPSLRSGFRVIPQRWRQSIRDRLGKRAERSEPLTENEKELIRAKLRPEMKRLRDEYGVNVAGWDPSA